MKSIKPGRAPSAIGAFASIGAAVFGVFWTISSVSIGAPLMFPLFGVFFIVMSILNFVFNYKNATSKNRFSTFDIVDSTSEPDPLSLITNQNQSDAENKAESVTDDSSEQIKVNYCPYCGTAVGEDFDFCASCGMSLPT